MDGCECIRLAEGHAKRSLTDSGDSALPMRLGNGHTRRLVLPPQSGRVDVSGPARPVHSQPIALVAGPASGRTCIDISHAMNPVVGLAVLL